ncbi:hypothetical protein [Lysinibacillus sp. NPDC056232]|uniref:hypothetical protein n=1 Tax=Lysinibacillus sp. NPDC056232 TaxID=3345756 RepID=UPI0035DD6163
MFNFFQQMFFVAKAKRQLQFFSVAKAKRQLQMSYVLKTKRQVQKSPTSIAGEMKAGLSCFSADVWAPAERS